MTVFSMLKRTPKEIAELERAKAHIGVQPSIEFYQTASDREEKSDAKINDKENYRTFSVNLNPGDEADENTYEIKIKVLRGGTPERWCQLRRDVDDLATKL